MNKNGKVKPMNILIGIGGVLGVILIAALLLNAFGVNTKLVKQEVTSAPGTSLTPTTGGTSGTGGITVNTPTVSTLSFAGYDAAQPGTTVGISTAIRVAGDSVWKTGVTSLEKGTVFDVIFYNSTTVSAMQYHPKVLYNQVASSNTLSVGLDKNATFTLFQFYNTANTLMTTGGTGTNATSTAANGETLSIGVKFAGQNLASTNPLRCIIEVNDTSKYDLTATGSNFQFPGAVAVAGNPKPQFYSLASGTSGILVYDLPALSASPTLGTLNLVAKSTKTLATTDFIVNCYSKDSFIDPISNLPVQAIEDSQGTAKYISHATFTGYVN